MKAYVFNLYKCELLAQGSATILFTQYIAAPDKKKASMIFIGYLGQYYPEIPVIKKRIFVEEFIEKNCDGTVLTYTSSSVQTE